ncbi:MAG: TonB-dependent receptor [Prosthecochloris sp.]|nr:TonB-dependent receptor [Prosthecochloris sp.]
MQQPSVTRRALKALCAVLLFAPASASAAESARAASPLPEIVVTATKTAEDPFFVPSSIETVSPAEIEREVAGNTPELLEKVPGVSVEGSGAWEAAPIIRGFSGTRTLVLVDGERENNLWAGRDPLSPFIGMADIERIEVLKGPASVLYGSDALGGVINFITKKPDYARNDTWQFSPEASVRYSSVDEGWQGSVALEGGGDGFDFRVDASARDHGNYTDGNGDEVANSQFEAQNLGIRGRYLLSDQHELSLSYRHNDIDDRGVPQKDNAPWSHFTKFDSDIWKASYTARDLGIIGELQLKGWLVDQERVYDGRLENPSKDMYTLKSNTIETGAKGTSLQLTFAPADNNTLVAGIEYIYEDAESAEEQVKKQLSDDTTKKIVYFPPVSDARREHVGIYAEDKHDFGNGSVLTASIRYDYFSAEAENALYYEEKANGTLIKEATNVFDDKTDQALTASIGYLYPLSSTVNLAANAATGFRAPDIFERFSTRGGSTIIIGNPDLEPEYSWNIDTGLKVNSGKLTGSFSLFYSWIDDYIDLQNNPGVTFGGLDTQTYVNVAEAELYGFDGGITWQPVEHLSLFGTVASVIGKNTTSDQRLNSIPPLNGSLGIRWEDRLNDSSKWWAEVETELFDDQDNPAANEKATPGYALFNVKGGIRYKENVTFSLAVDNLFDRTYRSHLNYADFLCEPGINIKTSLKVSL